MKPRAFSSTTGQVLYAADLDTIQDAIRDIDKCGGNWIGNIPQVWCADRSTLIVGAHKGLVLDGVELAAKSQTTVSLDGVLTTTGWWYLYAVNSGTDTVSYTLSDDSPEDEFIFKDGDPDSRYVCSVYCTNNTLHSERILPFRKVGNRVTYRWTGGGLTSDTFRALNVGVATTATDVDLTAWVPPRVRMVHLRLEISSATINTAYIAKVSPKGDAPPSGTASDSQLFNYAIFTYTGQSAVIEAPCECDIDGFVQYRNNSANVSTYLHVRGYEE